MNCRRTLWGLLMKTIPVKFFARSLNIPDFADPAGPRGTMEAQGELRVKMRQELNFRVSRSQGFGEFENLTDSPACKKDLST